MKKPLLLLLIIIEAGMLTAQPTKTLSFQGVLLDPTSNLPVMEGSYDFEFKLYNVSTGGTALWTETQSGITVDGEGQYQVVLGSQTALTADFNEDYWLEIVVNTINLGRTKLTGATYALGATTANTAHSTVRRDASGDFSAGTITADLVGDVTGNISGNAATVTTNANLSGDITSTGNATSIAAGVIVNEDINSNAEIADSKLATISSDGKVANSATSATSENTVDAIVARDATGNFSAGVITASLSGNASTASKLETARTIALTGDVTGSASFDGSGNVSITANTTNDPTLTLSGDATGSATFTDLGNASLSVAVVNDSHTHDGRYFTESEADARYVNAGDNTGENTQLSKLQVGYGSSYQPSGSQVLAVQGNSDGDQTLNTSYLVFFRGVGQGDDILAIQSGQTTPDGTTNFITFFNGSGTPVGSVDGTGTGGVEFKTSSADIAEWLPKESENNSLEPGSVVGIKNGHISLNTSEAEFISAVTSQSIVTGNWPGANREIGYEKISFLGQVKVKVIGPVEKGDFILPSGKNDGIGIALKPSEILPEHYKQLVGVAWEASNNPAVKTINTSIGLYNSGHLIEEQARVIKIQEKEIESLNQRLELLESKFEKYLKEN